MTRNAARVDSSTRPVLGTAPDGANPRSRASSRDAATKRLPPLGSNTSNQISSAAAAALLDAATAGEATSRASSPSQLSTTSQRRARSTLGVLEPVSILLRWLLL